MIAPPFHSAPLPGACIICGRLLPKRRWWQLLKPPPFCKNAAECQEAFNQRWETGEE